MPTYSPNRRPQQLTLRRLRTLHIAAFRDQVARGVRSEATLGMHERTWGYLERHFGARADVRRLTRKKIRGWLEAERRGRGARRVAPPTLRLRLSTLRQAMKLAQREGVLRRLPAFPETAVVYRSRTPFLESPSDFWRLFDEIERTCGPERSEYFALCVFTCQRASDVERMLVREIWPYGRTPWVTIRSTKTRAIPVRVVCPRELARIFRRKFKREGTADVNRRLVSPWPARVRTLPAVCARLGLPRITATAARHTGITWAVSRVGITPALLRWTGHRNPTIVAQVYAHALGAQLADVAAALDHYAARGRRKLRERTPPALRLTGRGANPPAEEKLRRRRAVPRDGIEPPTQGFSAPVMVIDPPGRNPSGVELLLEEKPDAHREPRPE
jgi:integrase